MCDCDGNTLPHQGRRTDDLQLTEATGDDVANLAVLKMLPLYLREMDWNFSSYSIVVIKNNLRIVVTSIITM